MTLTIDDPEYHRKLAYFAKDMARELAEALTEEKVEKSKAQSLVGSMMFNFAMMFDQGGHYRLGGKFKPKLAFDNGLGQLIVPTEPTRLHESVFDIVEDVYNEAPRRE